MEAMKKETKWIADAEILLHTLLLGYLLPIFN